MALSNDPFGLIGCNEEESYLTANPSWHGGKVHFTCKLVKTDKSKRTDSLKLVLEEPVLGPSCRFTRRFGSESFIRVKVSRDIMRSGVDLQKFFRQSFVFNDRVYKAFYAKDTTVFMIHVANELYSKGDPSSGLKFLAFIEWHNPMKYNLSQVSVALVVILCIKHADEIMLPVHGKIHCQISTWRVELDTGGEDTARRLSTSEGHRCAGYMSHVGVGCLTFNILYRKRRFDVQRKGAE